MKRTSMLIVPAALVAVAVLWGTSLLAEPQSDENVNAAAAGEAADSASVQAVEATPEVVAYYFHTTARCASCKKIEAYSREAIETGFAQQLRDGTLKFEAINVDEAENEHFVEDYQLYTKSLIICDMDGEKQAQWKNLAKVWELIRNKDEFIKYVQDEINAYLKES